MFNSSIAIFCVIPVEVDSQTLSQINCLRVTVHSLVLNSVGIKRMGSAPKKKGSLSHSSQYIFSNPMYIKTFFFFS